MYVSLQHSIAIQCEVLIHMPQRKHQQLTKV